MEKEDLMKLAEVIRDGKATDQEKLQLFQALNLELAEISSILAKPPNHEKYES